MFGQVFDILAGAVGGDVLLDAIPGRLVQAGGIQRLLEERAGVVEFDIAVAILEMANVAERKDRLAAISFAAHHRGNRAGRRDGRSARHWRVVADAMLHCMIAHELHDLGGKLLPFGAAVTDAEFVHHVARPMMPRPMRRAR